MEAKKISFGFMKTKKQDKPVVAERKEYIECVEEKSIKVLGGEDVKEEAPLIIPMKPNTLITAERLKEIAEKVENFEEPIAKLDNEQEIKDEKPLENETLDQMVARELLQEARKEKIVETPKLVVVPINSKPIMDGQKESTLDDYDSIPIQDFGMAMLRGMGWTPGKESTYKQPPLRPKGLGLGADKMIADKKKSTNAKDKEEELSLVKNSCVKIVSGKHNGYYGKVVSLDEDSGRVMVDITIKKETVSLNEFMVEAVSKTEFDKQSKVINSESYEQYKNNENISNSSKRPSRPPSNPQERKEGKSTKKLNNREEENKWIEEYNSNGRSRSKERRHRKDSSSSEEKRSKHRKKHKKRYSSNDSISSDSSLKQSVSRKRDSSSDSSPSAHNRKHKRNKSKNSKERRDIDKKRKGKKKKRDRDRSPNYKKHRK